MKFFNKKNLLGLWLPAFIFAAAVILFKEALNQIPGAWNLIKTMFSVLAPFVGGFVIAFILFIPQSGLEGLLNKSKSSFICKCSRGISIFVTYVGFVALVSLLLYFILPRLVRSLMDFVNTIPTYQATLIAFLEEYSDENGKLFGVELLRYVREFSPSMLLTWVNSDVLSNWASGIFKFGSALFDVVFAFICSIYMLAGREHLIMVVGRLVNLVVPKKKVLSLYDFLSRIAHIFYRYIYSQLIDALVVSVLLSIAFVLLGVPYAVLFGVLVGICNLIPYFGAVISSVFVALMVLLSEGWLLALITLAIVIGIGQLDANLLQPRIVGGTVGIRPIYVLLAITVGGGLFGIVGILLGVPFIATLRMIVLEIMRRKALIRARYTAEAETSEEQE